MSSLTSRFQIVENAAAPGSCAICGTSTGPFVDFGFQAEFYGAIVFCLLDAKDMGRSAGLVDPDKIEQLENQLSLANGKILNLQLAIECLVDEVNDAGTRFNDRLNGELATITSDSVAVQESPEGTTESKSTTPEDNGTVGKDSGSTGSEKSPRVSGNSDNGQSAFV